MTTYDWYLIFNLDEFNALGLVARTYQYNVPGKGVKDFFVTKGNLVSITYEGVMLSLNMNDENPFFFDDMGIAIDPDNNVWIGLDPETT